jgi:hypothetical protein
MMLGLSSGSRPWMVLDTIWWRFLEVSRLERVCQAFWLGMGKVILTWISGTLLNRLFGTNFDVMNESQRQQTTKGDLDLFEFYFIQTELSKGIWLSKARGEDILIMDVEGTDSRERGDEQV